MARILLYSTVPIVTKGFAVLLSSVPEFELISVCSSEQQFSQAIGASDPDLVLIDLDEETPLDRLLESRREISPQSRIVLWVQSISPELAYQTMKLGVRGILRKSLGADTIVKCLQRVSEGECWFEEALTAGFQDIRTVKLTRRESELLNLVSHGFKNKEIAAALFIAEASVYALPNDDASDHDGRPEARPVPVNALLAVMPHQIDHPARVDVRDARPRGGDGHLRLPSGSAASRRTVGCLSAAISQSTERRWSGRSSAPP